MVIAFVPASFASNHFGASAGARTLAYGAANLSGSLLVVAVATFNAAITVTVSDSVNGVYTQAGALYSILVSDRVSLWYAWGALGGFTPTLTVTPSASAYMGLCLHEYSGVLSSADPLHATASANSGGAPDLHPLTGTCTAAAGELVLGAYAQGSTNLASCSVASPFTLRGNLLTGGTDIGLGSADDVSAAGSEAATFSTSTSVNWAGIAASFKPAPAGGVSRLLASLGAGR